MRFIIFILILPLSLFAQEISFNNAYGNNDYDYGEAIVQLEDSSFVIAGATSSFGNGNSDALLLGIDKNGVFQWQRTFGANQIEWAEDLILHSNGSLYIIGYTNDSNGNGYDILLINTETDGSLIWSNTFGGSDWDFGYEMIESSDGNLVICGETYSNSNGQNDAYALKVDANSGELIWERNFGYLQHDAFYDLNEDDNGDIWFTGFSQQNDSDLYLVKTNSLGDQLSEFIQSTENQQIGRTIEILDEEIFLFFDYWKSNDADSVETVFRKLDLDGNLLTDVRIGETSFIRLAADLTALPNSFFILLSQSKLFSFNSSWWLFNSNGNFVNVGQTNTFGDVDDDRLNATLFCSDKGLIHVGTTESWGFGNSSVWVLKQDSNYFAPSSNSSNYVTNLQTIPDLIAFSVYPNPCIDRLWIDHSFEENLEFQIYDLSGRTVAIGNLQRGIDVSALKNGQYFGRLRNRDAQIGNFYFIKQ